MHMFIMQIIIKLKDTHLNLPVNYTMLSLYEYSKSSLWWTFSIMNRSLQWTENVKKKKCKYISCFLELSLKWTETELESSL